jgi:GAF domain-containing protein
MGAKSVVIVPLVVGGQRIGYLHANYDHIQTFSEGQRRRLGSLAQQAAIVVLNIRQLRATQARVRREQLIRQITGRIQEAPDVDGVLQAAIQELGRAFGTSRNRIQFRPPQRTDEDGDNTRDLDGGAAGPLE